MVKRKKSIKNKKEKSIFKSLGTPDKWEDGEKISKLESLDINGKKGISIRIGKRQGTYENYTHKIWIDEKFNFLSWIRWLLKAIQVPYKNIFGKSLAIEDLEKYKAEKEELTRNLTELQKKIDVVEKKNQESKEMIELLTKTKSDYKKDFRTIYKDFCDLIEESIRENTGKEEQIKTKIKEEPWLLGLECFVEAKNQNVDNQTEIDLHVKTKFNKDVIVEIKSPNINSLKRKNEKNKLRYVLSQEMSNALSEVVYYLRRTDLYSDISSEGVYGIQKAEGIIITGSNLSSEERKILTELNFHIRPHIKIITFDDLKSNIERELNLLEKVQNETENKIQANRN